MKLLVFAVIPIISHLGGSGVNFTPKQLYNKQFNGLVRYGSDYKYLTEQTSVVLCQ